jgi:hypothetical protein
VAVKQTLLIRVKDGCFVVYLTTSYEFCVAYDIRIIDGWTEKVLEGGGRDQIEVLSFNLLEETEKIANNLIP